MMSNYNEVAQKYAFSHYGNLTLVDEPVYDESDKVYVSNIRSDYPIKIRDDEEPNRVRIQVLKIQNLGKITIDRQHRVIESKTTSREECNKRLIMIFNYWRNRAENIIIQASSDKLIKIPTIRHYFDPIEAFFVCLWDDGIIEHEEINAACSIERQTKLKRYLYMLEGLDVVRNIDRGYVVGNTFLATRQRARDKDECIDALLSYIIRKRYSVLRDVFNLRILEPHIHIDNCIYLPELELEHTIHRSYASIMLEYFEYYQRRINPLTLRRTLSDLERVGAIARDKNHFFGNDKLLRNMITLKKELPSLDVNLLEAV